ncbi:MAG: dTDP-4-dehydrorhamnose 3,5-epimerase [Candidatus Nitrosotenuis sp.]|jgi:dTDP-4-dehydrorhamnose 3,5-epimerase
MTFTFKTLQIPDVMVVEPRTFSDERGFFLENFKESEFSAKGITAKFVQDNISYSTYGVIRGLHFQKQPKEQAKLITVIKGKVFDVAVDIRKNSPTYGRWVGEILSEDNHKSLYIPEGFAHGFCSLNKESILFYKVTNEYSREHERGIIWNDPTLNIQWPVEKPIISDKDKELPSLANLDNSFTYKESS